MFVFHQTLFSIADELLDSRNRSLESVVKCAVMLDTLRDTTSSTADQKACRFLCKMGTSEFPKRFHPYKSINFRKTPLI